MLRLAEETYEFIKGEVIALFVKYNINSIPIDGLTLARKMGILLVPYSSLSPEKLIAAMSFSHDGFYWERSDIGRECIYYNDSVSYKRINITILHEIGHCVLDHTSDMDMNVAEAEANFFAKYAAAPPPLVHMVKPKSPKDISLYFGLSKEAGVYAYNYYLKWLKYGEIDYTLGEKKLLWLFIFKKAG